MKAITWARDHDACSDAVEWLATLPEKTTLADAWETCHRSDWMIWALEQAGLCRDAALHEFACQCAEAALALVDKPDPRSLEAIRVKRAWMAGEASDEELAAARATARDAAWDAAWAARDAAWDARAAAWATARDAAWAARDAAWAARDAAWDARAAAWAARAVQANMLRELLGNPFEGMKS